MGSMYKNRKYNGCMKVLYEGFVWIWSGKDIEIEEDELRLR